MFLTADPVVLSSSHLGRFVVAFTIPYLLETQYAGLDSKVGFIFGSTAFCAIIFVYLCLPECKQRTLEEIDQLFLDKVPIRHFDKATVTIPTDNMDNIGTKGAGVKVDVAEHESV